MWSLDCWRRGTRGRVVNNKAEGRRKKRERGRGRECGERLDNNVL